MHENSHFPFPGESKQKYGKVTCWSVLPAGKVLYVRCWSLLYFAVIKYMSLKWAYDLSWVWIPYVKVENCIYMRYQISTLRFAILCKSNLHRYFEIKSSGLTFEGDSGKEVTLWRLTSISRWSVEKFKSPYISRYFCHSKSLKPNAWGHFKFLSICIQVRLVFYT